MKLLFFARHWSYLRNYESAIEELAARGHDVHMATHVEETMGGRQMIERLVARYPDRLSTGTAPGRALGAWSELARRIRHALDYLRFLEPRYESTPHLSDRARERAPRAILAVLRLPYFQTARGRAKLAGLLRLFERALPRSRELEEYIAAQHPDAVLITPLVDIGSRQLDHLRAAKTLGLRTILPVCSWDHLSSKALLRVMPDSVIVWNDVQRREAIDMHGVPPERVQVTGAQCYDQWWDRRPSRSREAFCARVGLRADRPFILYVCSSLFKGTYDEPKFVIEWIKAIRGSGDPRLKDIGLLIRPHPSRLKDWQPYDISEYRNVAFFGSHPVDAEAKNDYFDSMYYSAAVVGLNTSAFIESSVVGKPTHTVLLPEISVHNQEGTIHFHYLLTVNGGLLRAARSLEEHVGLLADSLGPEGGGDPKAAAFAAGFVRPFGADVAATPRFADAVERVVSGPAPAPEGLGVAAALARIPLYPMAAFIALHLRTQLWRKHFRNRIRKNWMAWKRQVLVDIKRFVTQHLKGNRTRHVELPPPSVLTPKLGHQRDPNKQLGGWGGTDAPEIRELVTLLGRSDMPIIAGPWLSETGFELLYWIPFLSWAKTYGNIDPDRIIVVSRGGAAPWYEHITPHYEDILSFYTADEFRRKNEERIEAQYGRLKHIGLSAFDREIIAKVREKRGLGSVEMLHPSDMYRLFDHFWGQRAPVTLIETFTNFAQFPAAGPWAQRSQLPDRYVAAKFYGNTALPDTPENRAFISAFIADLAQHIDVVLLNTTDRYDDHDDFPAELRGRVHTIGHLMRPENNLAVQTEVIRHASAFVGTYGGFSYLAPLVGTDTVAFYSHPKGFRFDHLEVAKRVFTGLQCGAFVEMDTRAVDVVRLALGGTMRSLVGTR